MTENNGTTTTEPTTEQLAEFEVNKNLPAEGQGGDGAVEGQTDAPDADPVTLILNAIAKLQEDISWLRRRLG